jgi:hypothetical protein
MKFLKDIEVPSGEKIAENIKEELKEEVRETVLGDTPADAKINADLLNCYQSAKATLGWAFNSVTGPVWMLACMKRKGYGLTEITKEAIERKFF